MARQDRRPEPARDVRLGDALLDGGDDGVRDYLTGGPGNDKFQRDWFWTGFFWANRDNPLDFSAGDSFYG